MTGKDRLRSAHGEVIGINVAGSSQAENIGFAIGIDAPKSLIQKVLTA